MNYFFQLAGIPIDGEIGNFDYSRFRLDVDESHLSETHGLTTDVRLALYGTRYFCTGQPNSSVTVDSIAKDVDWNCNGVSEAEVSTDINGDGQISALSGFDDWANIIFSLSSANLGISAKHLPRPQDELTPAIADRIPLFPVTGLSAKVVDKKVVLKWNAIPSARVVAYSVYREENGKKVEVGATPMSALVDAGAGGGVYFYSVVAAYKPYVRSNAQLAELNKAVASSQGQASKIGESIARGNSAMVGMVLDSHKLQESIESMGVGPASEIESPTAPPKRTTFANIPTTLLQTAPSKSVAVAVQ